MVDVIWVDDQILEEPRLACWASVVRLSGRYNLHYATDFGTALSLMRETRFSAVVVDMNIPWSEGANVVDADYNGSRDQAGAKLIAKAICELSYDPLTFAVLSIEDEAPVRQRLRANDVEISIVLQKRFRLEDKCLLTIIDDITGANKESA